MYSIKKIVVVSCSLFLSTGFPATNSKQNQPNQPIKNETQVEGIKRSFNPLKALHELFWTSYQGKEVVPVNELYLTTFYKFANLNTYYSSAYNGYCFSGNLCFSGRMNLEASYWERGGSFAPGQFIGVGVRPLFSTEINEMFGSMNNANLFVDTRINDWAVAHLDLAYVNGSTKTRFFNHESSDWGSVYRDAGSVKANSAFIFLANPNFLPIYAKVGKLYLNFGEYQQFPMTESLPQLLSQTRTGAIIVGTVLENGFYLSGSWSMAQQSIDRVNNFSTFGGAGTREKNWAAQAGFANCIKNLNFNFNASYMNDMRDVDYLSSGAWFFNENYQINPTFGFLIQNQRIIMERNPGIALHGDVTLEPVYIKGDYVSALKTLNPTVPDGKIYAWAATGGINMVIANFNSALEASYQKSGNSNVFQTILIGAPNLNPFGVAVPFIIGNILPRERFQLSYKVEVMPNVVVAAQWVRDKDSLSSQGGTRLSSQKAVLRLSAQA